MHPHVVRLVIAPGWRGRTFLPCLTRSIAHGRVRIPAPPPPPLAGPDLIVVGTKHTGIFCGHTCDIVVHESSVPVLVVRAFGQPFNPKARIMVAIDGSLVSLCALRYTMRLAPQSMVLVPVITVPGGHKVVSLVHQALETVDGPVCQVQVCGILRDGGCRRCTL